MAHHTKPRFVSRREFLSRTALSVSGLALAGTSVSAAEKGSAGCPIAVFSKVCQELKLSFDEVAELTAEAGLDGVDCPVRDGGEISPEKAADQLPQYANILQQHKLRIWLLTTGILSPASPFAETILRTGRQLGINYYRLGFAEREPGSAKKRVHEVRARLKDLAALNRELGMCALLQNHSPSGQTKYFGGDLAELQAAVESFDPAQIGVAFDIGHALVVHGESWKGHFESLRPHFKVAYVKDVKPGTGWVPFGEGEIEATGYFQILRKMNYHEPVSLHVEFEWSDHGRRKTRAELARALKSSGHVVRRWLEAA